MLTYYSHVAKSTGSNLVRKYQISHVWRSMVGRMAGDKPITHRTLQQQQQQSLLSPKKIGIG